MNIDDEIGRFRVVKQWLTRSLLDMSLSGFEGDLADL
jgi:hypothetical protein